MVVEIAELGPARDLELSPGERQALRRVGDRLRVEWLSEDRARISPAGHVGSIRLSDRLTINVTTKVPVANVLQLASLAYRSLAIPEPVGETDLRRSDPLDWLTVLLVFEAEALLTRSIRQGYVATRDELPYVRGRIRFEAAARGRTRLALLPCEFSDLLPDTPENRVLRATLEALSTRRLLPGLRERVLAAVGWLGAVTPVPPSPRLLDAVHLSRLNRHYRPALELCRLFLEGRGVEQPTGAVPAPAFFFPMERVFEAATANDLARRFPGVEIQREYRLDPAAGDPCRPLTFKPDVIIGCPSPALILDTKYRAPEVETRFGGLSFRNDDVYQIASYALALGCPGALVYPKADRDVRVTFDVASTRFTILTVDLGLPGLAGLETLGEAVAELLEAVPRRARTG